MQRLSKELDDTRLIAEQLIKSDGTLCTLQHGSTTEVGKMNMSPVIQSQKSQNGNSKQKDCVENMTLKSNKKELAKVFAKICSLQKQFGKTEAELKTLVDGFVWMLGDQPALKVFEAIKQYVLRNNDIPTPSDVMNIIDPPKEEHKWCVVTFLDIKRRKREGQFVMDHEEQYCSDFIAARTEGSVEERGMIDKAITQAEQENRQYWLTA